MPKRGWSNIWFKLACLLVTFLALLNRTHLPFQDPIEGQGEGYARRQQSSIQIQNDLFAGNGRGYNCVEADVRLLLDAVVERIQKKMHRT